MSVENQLHGGKSRAGPSAQLVPRIDGHLRARQCSTAQSKTANLCSAVSMSDNGFHSYDSCCIVMHIVMNLSSLSVRLSVLDQYSLLYFSMHCLCSNFVFPPGVSVFCDSQLIRWQLSQSTLCLSLPV